MFNKFKYVYAVYIHKSFTKAAQSLYISQPSLSAAIKKIESKIGAPLFERQGFDIRLTEIGVEYIKSAEQILFAQKDFMRKLNDIYSLESGRVNIGGTNYLSSYIIPKIISRFGELYPNIETTLSEANSTSLRKSLDDEKIDILIDSFSEPDEKLEAFPLIEERILLCVPSSWNINDELKKYQIPYKNNRLDFNPKTPAVPLERFKEQNFILLKSGNDMNKRAMDIFAETKINPPVSLYVDQLNISYALAESSIGASFVTDTIVNCSFTPHNLNFYLLDSKYNIRTLYIAYKKGRYCTKAMSKFIEVATELIN